ncbi:UDP-N-acetylmuramoyl-tripeptide--D-alanyl-D-alanine ligase [Limnobacter thiooxidans]|uniref:UDP-N-acetylmuramoyl-tripeptide--D-alanyl-D-alanine ligase n=1 Tax=Limnobacter thiooxidans TaxID=131080 RepID=A0AA86MHC5_9BURK|nr:UDP-N-acetylmuramoyl-tripeptide--D-alanyl-D-alanine ligase [Limnobacter thiooxidans]BET24972.1 UDP-N-acetylmuramoyl-tripeptide--D-alanyl-D-alanine ligase [Limnobacter thiooxidans]
MLEMNWDLNEIGDVLVGQLLEPVLSVSGSVRLVQTDSRQVAPGDLFVCLAGERFDAHDFASEVVQAGACALVTNRLLDVPAAQFVVKDTRVALGALASAWRHRFNIKVLAVVGSNGKTTSKEMLGSICKSQFGADKVLVTAGNLNNDIGVPQTLLKLRDSHQVAVIEMGMNHPGEIDYLASLVKPDVVLLTNAQREHQEFMKTVMAVARENGSAFSHLPPEGVAVFPVSEEFESTWLDQSTGATALRFGAGADFELQPLSLTGEKGWAVLNAAGNPITLQPTFIGEHNYANAAGAAAAAHVAGCSAQAIQAGLENFQPVNGRLQIVLNMPSLLLINDSYNANPDSVNAASKVLAAEQGNTLLVLGDMGEVGDQSDEYHAEVGQFARQAGVHSVYAIGEATQHTVRAFGEGAHHFNTIDQLINQTMSTTSQGRWSVLVKGSRFMKMERVVQALVQHYTAETKHAS